MVDAVAVRDLGVRYGAAVALAGVSFRLRPGELVALVGPNGAGKSSLLRAMAGLVPSSGEVVVGAAATRRARRGSIAYLPQRSAIDPMFPITVGELVLSGRRPFLAPWRRPAGTDRAAVVAALDEVGLARRAGDGIGTLSGGQLQRALVARALAQEASVLLLDEPLVGVDVANVDELVGLLGRLAAAGRTIVVSTHDLGVTRRWFGRCLAVNRMLVGDGRPADVLAPGAIELLFGRPVAVPVPGVA